MPTWAAVATCSMNMESLYLFFMAEGAPPSAAAARGFSQRLAASPAATTAARCLSKLGFGDASRCAGVDKSCGPKSKSPLEELVWRLPSKFTPRSPPMEPELLEAPRTKPPRRTLWHSVLDMVEAVSAPNSEPARGFLASTGGARARMQKPGPSNFVGLCIPSSAGPQMCKAPLLVRLKMYGIGGGQLPSSQSTCKLNWWGDCEMSTVYSPMRVLPRSAT
mmetsp:Transcript_88382/g.254878  ORF Transcript_88382/g.254878 Transcript_88382/m.254878 type:complete len:220 (-) Transcript_88382:232-891(-)